MVVFFPLCVCGCVFCCLCSCLLSFVCSVVASFFAAILVVPFVVLFVVLLFPNTCLRTQCFCSVCLLLLLLCFLCVFSLLLCFWGAFDVFVVENCFLAVLVFIIFVVVHVVFPECCLLLCFFWCGLLLRVLFC